MAPAVLGVGVMLQWEFFLAGGRGGCSKGRESKPVVVLRIQSSRAQSCILICS